MGNSTVNRKVEDMFRQADSELQRPGRQLSMHPFILGVEKGTLNKSHLKAWAEQVFLHVSPPVKWLGVTYANCDDDEIRKIVFNVLVEEATGQISGTKAHPELIADFAEAVGSVRANLKTNAPLPATEALVNLWEILLCHRHWAVAMGGMGFGGERQIPATFRKATEGLAKHYGISDKNRQFFDVHIGADEDHGDEAIEIVMRANPTDAMLDDIHRSIIMTAESMWNCWMAFEAADAAR